jgi:uncharacterized surface protein with fasciclin (FAS1) repeats
LPPTTTSTSTTTTTIPLAPLWDFIDSGDPENEDPALGLSRFVAAVEDAGLVALFDGSAAPGDVLTSVLPQPPSQQVIDLLNSEGMTVLAPTNGAIANLPTWPDIEADQAALQRFVLAHAVAGQFDEQELFATPQVTALSGDVLQIDAGTQTINGAHLVVIDQLGTNGIAHSVDAVLVVPTVTPPTTLAPTTAAPPAPPEPAPTPPPPPSGG